MAAGDRRHETAVARLLGENAANQRLIGCNADGMLYTHPWSNFGITQDLLTNDSDKTFTVPADHLWIIHWIGVRLISTANAGNRQLVIELADAAANLFASFGNNGNQAASTTILYLFAGGMIDGAGAATLGSRNEMPTHLILPAAFTLRVYDQAAIDAAADDMEVTIGRQEIDDT